MILTMTGDRGGGGTEDAIIDLLCSLSPWKQLKHKYKITYVDCMRLSRALDLSVIYVPYRSTVRNRIQIDVIQK